PLLIEKVRDIVGLYKQPTTHAVLCRREVADSGAGSHPTGVADAPRPARASHARLPAAWHHHVVRGPEREDQRVDHPIPSAPSRDRVPSVPRRGGRGGAAAPRRASVHGQLRHPQTPLILRIPGSNTKERELYANGGHMPTKDRWDWRPRIDTPWEFLGGQIVDNQRARLCRNPRNHAL